MVKASKLSLKILILAFIFFIVVGIFGYYFLTFKIEKSIDVILKVDKFNNNELIVDGSYVYSIKNGQDITLKIYDEFYTTKIQNITFDDNNLDKATITIDSIKTMLIPNSTIKAKIIINNVSLINSIFG